MRDLTDRFIDSLIISSFTIVCLYLMRYFFLATMKDDYFKFFDGLAFTTGCLFLIASIFISLKRFEEREKLKENKP